MMCSWHSVKRQKQGKVCHDILTIQVSTCLEADEWSPGLLECHGISLLVPILFLPDVFSCSYLIGGTIPTSLLVLVETIFTLLA